MQVTTEELILLAIFGASYLTSMYTQVSDPKIILGKQDWIISFLWSFIGGFLAYRVFLFSEENPGLVWVYTIVISVMSPRIFRFFVNPNNQDRFIESFANKFLKKKTDNEPN